MRDLLIIFLVIIVVTSCEKKIEFFPLNHLRLEIKKNETTNGQIAEHIVVANPPKKIDSLALLITRYNDTTLSLCEINKMKLSFFRRTFYRETRNTSRDFKNDEGFIPDRITSHNDDAIAKITFDSNLKWVFKVRKNKNSKWVQYPLTINCND